MAEKSPDAFRTISEVADELDLPQHVLRFWESKFSAIKPLKRGGGRRYYRPGDIDFLRGIRHLLYSEGFTIKGVQKILREQGVRFVAGCWRDGQRAVADLRSTDDGGEPDEAAAFAVPTGAGAEGGTVDIQRLRSAVRDLRAARAMIAGVRRLR